MTNIYLLVPVTSCAVILSDTGKKLHDLANLYLWHVFVVGVGGCIV